MRAKPSRTFIYLAVIMISLLVIGLIIVGVLLTTNQREFGDYFANTAVVATNSALVEQSLKTLTRAAQTATPSPLS